MGHAQAMRGGDAQKAALWVTRGVGVQNKLF
jgi:hypothetical protein